MTRCALKIENALWSHIEKQVEDAEVWQEAVALLINLIIWHGIEVVVGLRMFGCYGISQIDVAHRRSFIGTDEVGCHLQCWMNIE